MKFWASLSKAIAKNNNNLSDLDLPSHERHRLLKDPKAPKLAYLQEIQDYVLKNMEFTSLVRDGAYANKVRTSLVLSREEVQKLKKWVVDKSKEIKQRRTCQHLL